ncbi:MAG: AAA family ATPase [Sneathiellales bacterium]|nr:AAA family ATPase [Sneathiellales bacterium]
MQRIMIIGCAGAGKTTLAQNLAERLDIPWFSMDQLYWNDNWTPAEQTEIAAQQNEILARDHWIIEGNYSAHMPVRLARADAVIFLDFPLRICFPRVLWRSLKYRGQVRPHMAEGCPERFDLEFLSYVLMFQKNNRPGLNHIFEAFDGQQIRLTRKSAVSDFLQSFC